MRKKIRRAMTFIMLAFAVVVLAKTITHDVQATQFDIDILTDAVQIIRSEVNRKAGGWKNGDIVILKKGDDTAAYMFQYPIWVPVPVPGASGNTGPTDCNSEQ